MLLIEELPSFTFREIDRLMRIMWPHKPVVTMTRIAKALCGLHGVCEVGPRRSYQQKPDVYNPATEVVSQYCF